MWVRVAMMVLWWRRVRDHGVEPRSSIRDVVADYSCHIIVRRVTGAEGGGRLARSDGGAMTVADGGAMAVAKTGMTGLGPSDLSFVLDVGREKLVVIVLGWKLLLGREGDTVGATGGGDRREGVEDEGQ